MSSSLPVRIPFDHGTIDGLLGVPRSARGLVLFAHGSGSSRLSPRNNFVAGVLRKAGLATLLMDLLTGEEEDLPEHRFDIRLLTERLMAAGAWVKTNEETESLPLGLFGASTGSAAALEAASLLGPDVFAVVSRGGRPDMASLRALAGVMAPTLFLVGELDREVIALNREAFGPLRCAKKMVIVPGATHLFEEPGTLEEVGRLATDWFLLHLPPHA
ncbi:MAG: alpha/beta hydrolase [Nitrospirae bacterium]|nr:alpha/beta hydrolase [Nitrospirota bacterium]MCL5284510.1 alpha/beta hydrolase [Nitrospirota bacterium]